MINLNNIPEPSLHTKERERETDCSAEYCEEESESGWEGSKETTLTVTHSGAPGTPGTEAQDWIEFWGQRWNFWLAVVMAMSGHRGAAT